MTTSKRCATSFDFVFFSFSSFSLLQQGPGKGDTPKGILLREGNGPRAPLLIRGSKASPSEGFNSRLRALGLCDGTSQVIRPTYSCPCLTDIRHPVDVPKSLDKFGIFRYLTRNVSPVLQTLQNIGDKEMRKLLHKLTFI
jgi:hypothetical protein